MNDIEALRQRVIDAARDWHQAPNDDFAEQASALGAAVEALDAAMTPDPWALLEEVWLVSRPDEPTSLRRFDEMSQDIEAALQWRKENP